MSAPGKNDALGFPPPLLGEQPLRLPVLARGADWIALAKPAGVAVRQHPWDAHRPDLDAALNVQLEAGKPELVRLGATLFGSVFYLDPEIAGAALFGTTREGIARLRNRFGSADMAFEFCFVARASEDGGDEREVAAPLLPHRTKPKMIPSTAKGKKARSEFRRIAEGLSGWSLWLARVDFFRPHQVRAHAPLAGLSILGDADYGGPPSPLLSELKSKARGPGLSRPVFEGPAVQLCRIEHGEGESLPVPAAPAFALLRKQLGFGCD